MTDNQKDDFKCGFVALLGKPNAGKSTLLNRVIGEKISIVTPKPQTTRHRIHGILNHSAAQIVVVDTPGFCGGESSMQKVLRRVAGTSAVDADITVLMIELKKNMGKTFDELEREIRGKAEEASAKLIVALNKVDRMDDKREVLPWIERYSKELPVVGIVPISAKTGDGVDSLLKVVLDALPKSPPVFPLDLHTDQAERFMCEELVREQVLLQTHQEVPHSAAVILDAFDDDRREGGGLCRLNGRIILEKDSQKGILVGKRGARIKEINTKARESIEELLGCKVFLQMIVVVDDSWTIAG